MRTENFFEVELNTAIQAMTAWCNLEYEWRERANRVVDKDVTPAQPFGIKQ